MSNKGIKDIKLQIGTVNNNKGVNKHNRLTNINKSDKNPSIHQLDISEGHQG